MPTSAVGSAQPRPFWYYFRKHYVESEEILAVYGSWVEPSEQTAKGRYHKNHTHHTIYDVSSTRTMDLKIFGQGHMLYFYFIKYMAVVFGLLAACVTLPEIIIFCSGSWFPSTGDLEKSTMGNFGLVSSNNGSDQLSYLFAANPSVNTSGISFTGFGSSKTPALEIAIAQLFRADGDNPSVKMPGLGANKSSTIVALSIIDLIAILSFFFFSLYFIVWTRKLAEKADATTVTIRDYSVRVRKVPNDVTDTELRKWFEKWGEVAQVDLAYACSGLIEMAMERKETLGKQERALAILQRSAATYPKVDEDLEYDLLNYRYDVALINRAIKNQQRIYGNKNVVEAFVVYKDEVGKRTCLEAQPRYFWRRWRVPLEDRFRGTHALFIEEAPEPSDLKFENLEYKKGERLMFWLGSWSLKLLLLVVGFALISLAPAIKSKLGAWQGGASVSDCDAYCTYTSTSGVPSLNQTLRDTYKTCADTGVLPDQLSCDHISICYECYCRMVLTAGMLGEAVYCSEYKGVLALQIGSQALTVATIVLVNLALPYIINFLSESIEKHQTRSSEARSTARALLLMYFLNTAISIMLANAYFPNVHNWQGLALLGIYSDLTPHWYSDVAHAIIISQILGIPSRMAVIGYDIWQRNMHIKGKWQCLTQRELNHAFDGPEFTLSDKYGEHLGVVFVCMLFSSAVPLMYWTTFASFVIMYWLEKYYLLKCCRWPINYNADLAKFVTEALPFSVLWHLAFAFWAFSFIAVARSPLVGGSLMGLLTAFSSAMTHVWANTSQMTVEQVASRLAQANAFHLFGAFWLCAIGLFVFLTLDAWIRVMHPVFDWLATVFHHGQRVSPEQPAKPASGDAAPSDPDEAVLAEYAKATRSNPLLDDSMEDSAYGDAIMAKAEGMDAPDSPQGGVVGMHYGGVPEFDIAVRSQLLIGPASYNIRDVSIYEEAFADIEEEAAEEIEALEKRLQEHGERGGLSNLKELKRKALRERAEDLAKEEITKPMTRAVLENEGGEERRRTAEPEPEPAPSEPALEEEEEAAAPSGPSEPGWQKMEDAAPRKKSKTKKKKKRSSVDPNVSAVTAHDHAVGPDPSAHSVRARAATLMDDDVEIYGRL